MGIQVGDIVARKSYNCDILFRVTKVSDDRKTVTLVGEDVRLIADAPVDDLIVNHFDG
jgi:spore coat assembly protein